LGTIVRPEYGHGTAVFAVRNFPLIRFEGAERVQHIFKAVDNSRGPRPALHKPAPS
jgi:hypothetical protein